MSHHLEVCTLMSQNAALIQALQVARLQLVALGGDIKDPTGDQIQKMVLEVIDEAITVCRS